MSRPSTPAALSAEGLAGSAFGLAFHHVGVSAAALGNTTLIAAVVGRHLRVTAAFLISAGIVEIRFEDGAGGAGLLPATGATIPLIATTGFVLPFNPGGWFQTSLNTLLNLSLSDNIAVTGCLQYVELP